MWGFRRMGDICCDCVHPSMPTCKSKYQFQQYNKDCQLTSQGASRSQKLKPCKHHSWTMVAMIICLYLLAWSHGVYHRHLAPFKRMISLARAFMLRMDSVASSGCLSFIRRAMRLKRAKKSPRDSISVGALFSNSCRFRDFWIADFGICGFSDIWISGSQELWVFGCLDFPISGLLDYWICGVSGVGFPNIRISGFSDFWIFRSQDFFIFGFLGF